MTTKKQPTKKNNTKAVVLSEREAPVQRTSNPKEYLAPVFNDAQMNLLLNKTPEYALKKRPGPGGKALTYVTHGYVTDQLNKAFGFDWDLVLDPISNGRMYELQIETIPSKNKDVVIRHLAVCGHLVVRVYKAKEIITITKSAFGSQLWHPSMEFGDALKAAKSDLLKACAMQVGVALDLYWNDMAENDKFEQAQQEKLQREQDEAVEAINGTVINNTPKNGVQLISMASSQYKMDLSTVEKIVGKKFAEIQADYKPEYWDLIVHSQEDSNEKKSST